MKISALVLLATGAIGAVAQTSIPDSPSCASWCLKSVHDNFTSYGCQSSTDYKCLCKNRNFGFAIHDCSHEYCRNDTAAEVAIVWANTACANVNEPINLPPASVPVNTGAVPGGANGTAPGGGGGGGSISYTASVVTTVITSGSVVLTETTTLFGGIPGTHGTTTPLASSPTSTGIDESGPKTNPSSTSAEAPSASSTGTSGATSPGISSAGWLLAGIVMAFL